MKGKGNSVSYKYRMHDPRIGRFFAVDPLTPQYPHNSPYAFSENRLLDGVELEGLEFDALIENRNNLKGSSTSSSSGNSRPLIMEMANASSSDGSLHSFNKTVAKTVANVYRESGNESMATATEIVGGAQLAFTARAEGIFNLVTTNPATTLSNKKDAAINKGVELGNFAKENNLSLFDAFAYSTLLESTAPYREGDVMGISEDISGDLIDYGGLAYGLVSALGGGISPATRFANSARKLPASVRPNTVAVIETADGKFVAGMNGGGVVNAEVINQVETIGMNQYHGQCAEVNAIARAKNLGYDLKGAKISVSNVRGPNSTTGIHGTPKAPCSTCGPLLEKNGIKIRE